MRLRTEEEARKSTKKAIGRMKKWIKENPKDPAVPRYQAEIKRLQKLYKL